MENLKGREWMTKGAEALSLQPLRFENLVVNIDFHHQGQCVPYIA